MSDSNDTGRGARRDRLGRRVRRRLGDAVRPLVRHRVTSAARDDEGQLPAGGDPLAQWLEQPSGQRLLEQEIAVSKDLLANLFGYHLALVGSPAFCPVLTHSRILTTTVVTSPGSDVCVAGDTSNIGNANVVHGTPDALPFGTDSVDVVLLPHVLEFSPDPHATLRDVERVLVGEGHLILTGFNPRSALGLWRACLGRRRRNVSPWNGEFFTSARIKDWLSVLGFDIVATHASFFGPPLNNQKFLARTAALDDIGRKAFPYVGGAYVLAAKKRLTTVTPIRPSWRSRRRLVSVGIAEPSRRADRCATDAGEPRPVPNLALVESPERVK